jgi:hypothetical protein
VRISIHLSALLCLIGVQVYAQQAQVEVLVRSRTDSMPLADAVVQFKGFKAEYRTDASGRAVFEQRPGKYQLRVRYVGYLTAQERVDLYADSSYRYVIYLREANTTTETITISDSNRATRKSDLDNPFDQLAPLSSREISQMAGPSQSLERLFMSLGGVGTSSEFSSQYRVRGGNYDENLIYIHDIEIYRPQIVRTGLQEGLSITNPALTQDVKFSTGGFGARYGDKLSSVMNMTYRTPNRPAGSVELGLLTQNLHFEGSTRNRRDSLRSGPLRLVAGARRFSTQYLLGTLDTQGDYQPTFWDAQAMLTWVPSRLANAQTRYIERADSSTDTIYLPPERLKISVLGLITRSKFLFLPSTRETTFGTFNTAFRLFVAFVGEEQTNYTTGQGGLLIEHRPSMRLQLKYIVSGVRSLESELTTVEGGYRLGDVNTGFGNENFNEVVNIIGIGSELRNARNFLLVEQVSGEVRGDWRLDRDFHARIRRSDSYLRHTLSFGIRALALRIEDQFREWVALDSADYARVTELIRADHRQTSQQYHGFSQYTFRSSRTTNLIGGVRVNHNTLNGQTLISPRAQFVWEPGRKLDSLGRPQPNNLQVRAAIGYYAQPAFYRELRNFEGRIFPETRAQESVHYILGTDYVFKAWGRSFKLFTELYYKDLLRIIPYELENVRLRYYPEHWARGYAYGIDARINGQFIEGIESWFSASVLQTREDVIGDGSGSVRRPSDQRLIFNMYFQDEVPRIPTLKVHINLVYNSGLPFGPPRNLNNRTIFQIPSYQRVDIGLSKLISFRAREDSDRKFGIESLWIGLEVFNLLQRENTVSFTWVEDVNQVRFPVPNYLSARLINLRGILRF